jgi:radical SAM protein with 4Fe4S-binding SPASM domain
MAGLPPSGDRKVPAQDYEFRDSRRISRLVSDKGDPNAIIAEVMGPRYWEYRQKWDLARSFQIRLPFPLQVDYELLYACNLKCPICIMSLPAEERRRWGNPHERLSIDVVKELLDEGAAKGQAAVGLNGVCEPLLYPDLPEIIRYARSKGLLDIMFNTNGLLLDQHISRELISAGLTRIMISIDAATEPTYDRIRIGSDFERVCENVRRFVEIRNQMKSVLPIVRVSFCVTSLNEHELDDFLADWGPVVDFFSIQHYGNTFSGRYARERSELFPSQYLYDPGITPRCGQPWKRVMVRHNGQVIPCCDASGLHLVIGHIKENNLADIWRGSSAEEIRDLHLQGHYDRNPICRQCMTKWGPPLPKAWPKSD